MVLVFKPYLRSVCLTGKTLCSCFTVKLQGTCRTSTYTVALPTSFIPRKGSSTSGERRIQGANTIARDLGDILLCSSSFATLKQKLTAQDLSGIFTHAFCRTHR